MKKRQDEWEPEKIDELIALWHTGKPTSEIGRIMGITKNSVVGKASRLKLPSRPSPIKTSPPRRKKVKKKKKASIKKRPNGLPLVPLIDLKNNQCPWPYGDPQDHDFGFCGQEKDGKKNWCAEHEALGTIKTTRKRRVRG